MRRLRSLVLVLAALSAPTGCKRSAPLGVNLPRYAGASYRPQDPQRPPGALVYRGDLTTPDAFRGVVNFYDKEMAAKPGWKRTELDPDTVLWNDANAKVAGTDLSPIDPTQRAAMLIVRNTPNATIVHLAESQPAAAQ